MMLKHKDFVLMIVCYKCKTLLQRLRASERIEVERSNEYQPPEELILNYETRTVRFINYYCSLCKAAEDQKHVDLGRQYEKEESREGGKYYGTFR